MISLEYLTIDEIMNILPEEQINHCRHVELLVEKLVHWLPNSKSGHYLYFSKSAYYHDIGKVFISSDIIDKAGLLTQEEYDMIKCHTVFAKELLTQKSKSIMGSAEKAWFNLLIDAAFYHHEWWNGKGYPSGLCGKEIPYVARVTAICDAYEAMISNRVYRKAYSHSYACEEIRKGLGTQFDPELVKIFLEHESELECLFRNILKQSLN